MDVAQRAPADGDDRSLLVAHRARILHLPGVTKSGKTFVLDLWLAQGILSGERCIIVAPWFPRVRQHFEGLKAILRPSIASGEVQAAESLLRLRAKNGGGPDCYSADNSQAIYGANADCLVVDELSRIPAAAWPACLTTVTGASSCRIRTVLNLELGGKDWAIRIILRFQQMSEKERGNASEDFLMFGPDSSFVSAEIIELMRANMPRHLWEALYEGVIPSDDTSPLDALGRSLFTQKDEMVNLGGMVAIAIGLQTNGQLG